MSREENDAEAVQFYEDFWRALKTANDARDRRGGAPLDPHPGELYQCQDDGEVVVGPDGLREHRRLHRERGDDVPQWDVLP